MADRVLALEFDEETYARLAALAGREGVAVEVWARRQLESAAGKLGFREDGAAFGTSQEWAEADRRLAEYDRTGEAVDAETWLTELEAEARARRTE